jgi:NAD-dependent SIR2 family protein deacetylase
MNDFKRPCDDVNCIICQKKILSKDEGCLITVPSKRLRKLKPATIAAFIFKWDMTKSSNPLHFNCWKKHKKLSSTEQRIIDSIEDTLERFSTYAQIEESVNKVVPLLVNSKLTICFTGAGISTSAGIPDYRGSSGIDNVSDHTNKVEVVDDEEEEEEDCDYTKLQPTYAHKALVEMAKDYLLHYVVTQNCDNLHGKAGLPDNLLSELHGNVFKEYCEKCQTQYTRDYCVDVFSTDCHQEPYYVKCKTCGWNHYTGRYCEVKKCRGKLRDTIVNFGDDLHLMVCGGLIRARRRAKHADVCLTVGTSLTVYPASELPTFAKNLIIVNLQNTDFDDQCAVRVYTTADAFFKCLMPKLTAAAPKLVKRRFDDVEEVEDEKEVEEVESDDGEEEWEEEEESPKEKKKKRSRKNDDDEEEEAEFEFEEVPKKPAKKAKKETVIEIDQTPPHAKRNASKKRSTKKEVVEVE